jgi:eukaryotic-like serine/threonine-protein kinase
MTPDRWVRMEDLFHLALETLPDEREALLKAACSDDPALYDDVRALVRAHEKGPGFVAIPTLEPDAQESEKAAEKSLVGMQISHFTVLSKVGKGGMGEVYLARDNRLERQVALKILPTVAAGSEERKRRFMIEAKAAGALSHPNVVSIYDVNQSDGVHFIAMEFVEGETLEQRIKRGAVELTEIVDVGMQVCDALDAAHRKGITHRDIKPANLMLTSRGKVKVMDFGIAKINLPRPFQSDSPTLFETSPGIVLGTLHHMSPEQVLGHEIDHRTDIFSLGVSLYQMASGQLPFSGATATQTMDQILHKEPDAISGVPAELDRIIRRCLEKDGRKRYGTAQELLADLRSFREDPRRNARLEAKPSTASPPRKARQRVQIAVSVLSLVIVAVVSGYWVEAPRYRPAIAVLGFKNTAADSAAEWVSSALTELFRTQLSLDSTRRIIPAEDVARITAELSLAPRDTMTLASLAQVRKTLGADYVLLGGYFQLPGEDHGQVRVDAKIQSTTTGNVIASVTRSGPSSSLPQLVSEARLALARQLGVEPRPADPEDMNALLPRNPEAARLYSDGVALLRVYDATAAAESLKKAANMAPDSAPVRSALAEALLALGYQKQASEEAARALAQPADLPLEATLGIQARYHEIRADWNQAIALYQSLRTRFPDNPEHSLRLANAQTANNQGDKAIATLAELRQVWQRMSNDPRVDLAEAAAFEAQGESENEIRASVRAISQARSVGARIIEARAQLRSAWAHYDLSHWAEAAAAAQSARRTFADVGDRGSEASAVKIMADILDDSGDHTRAKEVYQEALAIFRVIGHQRGMAVTLNNMGEALRTLGDLEAAERSYNEALGHASNAGDARLQSIILNGVGSMQWRRGNLLSAQEAYQKAVNGLRAAGLKNTLANSLMNLATVLQDQGYLKEGLKSLEEAVTIATELNDEDTAARVHGNMGDLLFRQGDLLSAKRHFADQRRLGQKIQADRQSAYALLGLGQIDAAQGEVNEGIAKIHEAIRLHAGNKEDGQVAEARLALAEIEVDDNRFAAAADEARQAAMQFNRDGQSDQEALAQAILAYALATTDENSSSAAAARARELLPNIQHVGRRLSTRIRLTQTSASGGNISEARNALQSTLNEADKLVSVPHKLQVKRALCLIDLRECTASLEKEARDIGFLHVANTIAQRRPARR